MAGCETSTSVIFHIYGLTNLIQVKNAADNMPPAHFCKWVYMPGKGLMNVSSSSYPCDCVSSRSNARCVEYVGDISICVACYHVVYRHVMYDVRANVINY